MLDNLDAQITAEKQLETLQASRAQKLAEAAAGEQKRLDEMKTLMKAILADLQAFDKQGAKSPQKLADQQKRLNENVAKFKDLWLGGKKADVSELLAFDQLQRRVTAAIEGGVSAAEVKELYSTPETFSKFRADIEKGVGPVRLMIQWARLSSPEIWDATQGMSAEEAEQYISQRAQNTAEIIKKYRDLGDSLDKANLTLERSREEALAAADRWMSVGWVQDVRKLGGIWEQFTGHVANTPLVKQAREELVRAMAPFTKPGTQISTEELDKFKRAYDLYLSVLKPSEASVAALDKFQQVAEQAAQAGEDVQTKLKGLEAMRNGAEEAQALRPAYENALKAAEEAAKKAKESMGETNSSAQAAGKALNQVSQIDMSGLVGQTQAIADAMWSAATASMMVQPPAWEMTAAKGGKAWNFLATGGRPQGTDVIPAMLSPGEVVINAASARRFAAQLTAINAGVQPVYRSEGGSVTNIGDINVNVTGGGSSRQTARSIAAELRRELRRGTATL